MANPYYTPSGAPGTGAEGLSAQMRTEFKLIGVGFDLLPKFSTTGQFGTVFVQQGSYTFTLPNRAGSLALLDDVAQETARAQAAEQATSTALSTLGTSINSAIATEVTRAQAAETVLTTAINTEKSDRTNAVATERSDRQAAIAALSSGSSSTIGGVSASLTQEVADRKAADGGLTIRVSNVETAVANEVSRASGAESTNASAISAEVTRATAGEAAAMSAAIAERARAMQAEGNLQPALGYVPYNSSNPADFVSGSRLSTALGPYATGQFLSDNYASLRYVQGTFAPTTDVNGWPVARQYDIPTFNAINVTGGTVRANGSRQAAANGYAITVSGYGPFSGVVGISIETSNSMLAFGYYTSSDGRLKSNRIAISESDGERFVRECPPYQYVKNGTVEVGFIAQDLGAAGFVETLAASEDAAVPDEAFGYTGPHGKYLIMPDKTPVAYLAAALRSALARIEALEAKAGT